MPFLTDSLKRAFAAGTIVVTPNRRLARALVALHDREQRAAGRTVWPSPKALPWDAWLRMLWQEALAAGVVPADARLRSPLQSAHAWDRIVAAEGMPLIDPGRAAVLAADAWVLVHAWGAGGDSWRAWAGEGDATDDCALFARWASRHARELRNANAIDLAEFPDLFCAWASAIPSLHGAAFAFAGFAEFSPQQERLLVATAAAGATVTREDTLPGARGQMLRASGASPHDEIACALAWARAVDWRWWPRLSHAHVHRCRRRPRCPYGLVRDSTQRAWAWIACSLSRPQGILSGPYVHAPGCLRPRGPGPSTTEGPTAPRFYHVDRGLLPGSGAAQIRRPTVTKPV